MTGKPFIKLFHTPNSAYFLDVNRNEILQIGESSYLYLENEIYQLGKKLEIPTEIVELQNAGYLSTESNIKAVQHPYTRFLTEFLDRKMGKITLQVTQNCNFRCKYCIYTPKKNTKQRTHSQKSMSWETAKAAVDFLWNHSVDSKSVNVGFYGGEPLIEFGLIQKTIKYCKYLFEGKELSFNITCNGSLLTPEVIRFLSRNSVNLMISLDGPKNINDKNRVFVNGDGTFNKVMEGINLVKQIDPKFADRLQISMVIDPQNEFDCINQVFIGEKSINRLSVQPSIVDLDFSEEEIGVSEDYLLKNTYHQFLAVLSLFERFDKEKVSPIGLKVIESAVNDKEKIGQGSRLMTVDAPSGPCIPGQLRAFVDVDGRLFPCERVSETSSSMQIGDIYNGFRVENTLEILNVAQLSSEECKICWGFRYCNQCAKAAMDKTNSISAAERLKHCDDSRREAYHRISQYLLLQEIPRYYNKQIINRN